MRSRRDGKALTGPASPGRSVCAPLLDLKGHTSWVSSAAFGPDGTRIVTRIYDGTAKVWDARTGEELKDEPIPLATRPGQISPNRRRIAHIAGGSVELVPLQPDEEELAYRRFFMKPNFRFYRASYDAARAGKGAFLTRFYLGLFPPAEQNRIRGQRKGVRSLCLRVLIPLIRCDPFDSV